MRRSALLISAVAALGLSASTLAQPLEWVNGRGDATGFWKPAEYRAANGHLERVDATAPPSARVARPALSYEQLAAESETDTTIRETSQPRYVLEGRRLALQNPAPRSPRERVTMPAVERLYRDFSTG